MKLTLTVNPEAEADLQDAYDWYEGQQENLGESFMDRVHQSFSKILQNPKAFQKRHKTVRIHFIKQFPFGIHYTLKADKLIILAVLHTSRDPKSWRG